jgi:hypothetical protein
VAAVLDAMAIEPDACLVLGAVVPPEVFADVARERASRARGHAASAVARAFEAVTVEVEIPFDRGLFWI